jgi:hypothetical protein
VHVFAAEGSKVSSDNDTQPLGPPDRVAADVLNWHPVEVLAVKDTPQTSTRSQQHFWAKWINQCMPMNLRDYVIISAPNFFGKQKFNDASYI